MTVIEKMTDMSVSTAALSVLLLGLLIGSVQHALASSWQGELDNGRQISINPSTNRAVIDSGAGQGKPLWDGVHRLSDGSTITIRSGIVVPNQAVQAYQPAPAPLPTPSEAMQGDSPVVSPPSGGWGRCAELVLRSCGLQGSCRDSEPCLLAQQLRQAQHQPGASKLGNSDWAEQHCREALQDSTRFPQCHLEPPLEATACRQLLERFCAGGPRCMGSPSCRAAERLFEREQTALSDGADAELLATRSRCVEILAKHAFFPPCR